MEARIVLLWDSDQASSAEIPGKHQLYSGPPLSSSPIVALQLLRTGHISRHWQVVELVWSALYWHFLQKDFVSVQLMVRVEVAGEMK